MIETKRFKVERDSFIKKIPLSFLILKSKQKNYETPPSLNIKPKLKRGKKTEEELDILPPPPPPSIVRIEKAKRKRMGRLKWEREKERRKRVEEERKKRELRKQVLEEKRREELKKEGKLKIEEKRKTLSRLKEAIKEAEKKRKLEEQKEKRVERLRARQEKKRLKYEKHIKKLEESEKKKKDKKRIKEIKDLLIRLDSGIKVIDKHEVILKDSIEKNLKLTQSKLEQVKTDLKTEEDYIKESKKIKERIKFFENLVAQGKTNLYAQIEDLKVKYNSYTRKAEGVRRAILAKVNYIKKVSEEIEKEEKKQKEFEEEKKKILEAEKFLERKRVIRDVQGFFRKIRLYKTKEDKKKEELEKIKRKKELEKLRLERQKEQEKRIEKETKKRKIELKTQEIVEEIKKFEKDKARKEKAEEEKRRLKEKIKKTEEKRKKEKEKLMKGSLFIQLFKPKKVSPKEEIKEAIEQLKVPKVRVKPTFTIPKIAIGLNDVEYINQRIADGREALLNFDLERAKKIYIDILKVYNNLSIENKRKTYEAVKEFYYERKNAERVVKR